MKISGMSLAERIRDSLTSLGESQEFPIAGAALWASIQRELELEQEEVSLPVNGLEHLKAVRWDEAIKGPSPNKEESRTTNQSGAL